MWRRTGADTFPAKEIGFEGSRMSMWKRLRHTALTVLLAVGVGVVAPGGTPAHAIVGGPTPRALLHCEPLYETFFCDGDWEGFSAITAMWWEINARSRPEFSGMQFIEDYCEAPDVVPVEYFVSGWVGRPGDPGYGHTTRSKRLWVQCTCNEPH